MATIRLLAITLLITLSLGCTDKSKLIHSSKLMEFNYSGYSDTTCATLYGQILCKDEKGDTIPLKNVRVTVQSNNIISLTDSLGEFSTCNSSGEHKIEIKKEGFQIVTLENYIAKSDQVSNIKIFLEKGNESVKLMIPDDNDGKNNNH